MYKAASRWLIVLLLTLPIVNSAAQQRDRLAELNVECYRKANLAPGGSIWLVTRCGNVYRTNNIHSPWRTLFQPEEKWSYKNPDFEHVAPFNRTSAVTVGYKTRSMLHTTSSGLWWDTLKFESPRAVEWFHPVWHDPQGHLWAGSQDGLLIFSADSGRTFSTLRNSGFEIKIGIDDIYMLTPDSGWIAGHGNRIYTTSDNWNTFHRVTTPLDQKLYVVTDPHDQYWVNRVRPWKGYLIVDQAFMSFYTPLGDTLHWQHTPLPITDFEVDTATGALWALDDSGYVMRFENFDRWQRYPLRVQRQAVDKQQIAGIHDGKAYWLTDIGVVAISADGHMDTCAFLTDEHPIEEPHTLGHGPRLWGTDGESVYLLDSVGWYRVTRPRGIWEITPDPDREDRVIIRNYKGENYSVDTAGRVEPYVYRQPLEAFVKSGLQSVEIRTYDSGCYHYDASTIRYTRRDKRLVETYNTADSNRYITRHVPVDKVEQALLDLGARYSLFPTPQDFGLENTSLDLHRVWEPSRWSSTSSIGYVVIIVNQSGDTLWARGASSEISRGYRFPWLLPMDVHWREADFRTYQPTLWQTLRTMMPDKMFLRDYLDNNTLRPQYAMQNGDLLFVRLNGASSDMEEAISESTGKYTHVAILEVENDPKYPNGSAAWVIEADGHNGVKRTKWHDWELPNYGMYDIYRLAVPFDTAAVIERAKSFLGQPYDDAFLPDNGKMYCSELVYESFLDSVGNHLFEAKPMNWRNNKGNLPEYWKKHFEKLGVPVPEGIPGTNPTDMSHSKLLRKL